MLRNVYKFDAALSGVLEPIDPIVFLVRYRMVDSCKGNVCGPASFLRQPAQSQAGFTHLIMTSLLECEQYRTHQGHEKPQSFSQNFIRALKQHSFLGALVSSVLKLLLVRSVKWGYTFRATSGEPLKREEVRSK